MHSKAEACLGHWRRWLTEIPGPLADTEQLSIFSSGEALWSQEYGFHQEHHAQLQWRFDDKDHLLLITRRGSVLSRCEVELSSDDLMVITPAHGFKSLFERVAPCKEP